MPRKSRPKPGTFFELETARGYALVQYTHDGPDGDQIVAVFPLLRDSPFSGDLTEIAGQQVRFFERTDLANFLNVAQQKGVACVEHAFPTFRSPGLPNKLTGVLEYWQFWNAGARWTEATPLHPASLDVSVDGFSTIDDLVWRIESGWTPAEVSGERVQVARRASPDARYEYIVLAPAKPVAQQVRAALADLDLEVGDLRKVAGNWELELAASAWVLHERRESVERELTRRINPLPAQLDGPFLADPGDGGGKILEVRHRLGFADRSAAQQAANHLRRAGFETCVSRSGERWIATATAPKRDRVKEEDRDIELLEDVAARCGGRYEGEEFVFGGSECAR